MKPAVQIVRVPILPLGMVNAHLLRNGKDCVLVDTGIPHSEGKFQKALRAEGLSFKDIKLIVITHAHADHAGSAASTRELSGAPIVAYAADAKHYSGEVPMTYCPTGWFGRVFYKTGLPISPYTPFAPDILLTGTDTFDLEKFGFQGRITFTPGHTAGSISVELATHQAMVGDLLASGILLGGIVMKGRAMRPPFEDDPALVAKELRRLVDEGMTEFYMGHGGPLPAKEVLRHTSELVKIGRKR